MNMPWKLKSAIFAAADRVGDAPLYFAQKYITGRSRKRLRAVQDPWTFHWENLSRQGCKSLIEFGAGKNLAQNIFLGGLGIEQVLVDLNPMADTSLINNAIDDLAELGVTTNGHVGSLKDLRSRYGISYKAPVDMQATGFDDYSFDACISTNTLEHIPPDVIAGIWQEVRRIVKSGGIVSAQIDYSDHYAHTDRSITYLNFLRYNDDNWRRYNHPSHFQNRLRHRQQAALMAEAGLVIRVERCENPIAPPTFAVGVPGFGDEDSDYGTLGYFVAEVP